jgi:hypothetical protein
VQSLHSGSLKPAMRVCQLATDIETHPREPRFINAFRRNNTRAKKSSNSFVSLL